MSYDVLLISENQEDAENIYEFLAARNHYERFEDYLDYDNPDTGVHFQFIFTPYHEYELSGSEDSIHQHEIGHLRLNFCRPTAFAIEAAKELIALSSNAQVEFFDLALGKAVNKYTTESQLTDPYQKYATHSVAAIAD